MNEQQLSEKPESRHTFAQLMGYMRDNPVGAGAGVYAIGYVAWSIHTWMEDLGPVPALDAQYFLAGSVPIIIGFLCIRGGQFTLQVIQPVRNWLYREAKPTNLKLALRIAMWLIYAVWILLILFHGLLDYMGVEVEAPYWIGVYIFTTLAVFITTLLQAPIKLLKPTGNMSDEEELFLKHDDPRRINLLYAMVAFFCTFIYLAWIFPALPQELGGAQPRCANLDIITKGISLETLISFAPEYFTAKGNTDVVQVTTVTVFFARDFFLVRTKLFEKLELPRAAISAVTWRDIKDCNA